MSDVKKKIKLAPPVPVVPQHAPERHHGVIISERKPKRLSFFSARNQLRSLGVGLACGAVVVLAFLFVLFNEMVIAPFIRPSQSAIQAEVVGDEQANPVNADGTPAAVANNVRIPKISVDIPLVYGLPSTNHDQFELALDKGVVHYPTTSMPGQPGNTAFFGHSSNNIFNPGKYKFAFVLLHELEPGDKFSLANDGKAYEYEVISKRVVKPTEVSVLGPVPGYDSTATLITCDPPGTSINRLVVVGKLITPGATETTIPAGEAEVPEAQSLQNLPGNGPGLFNRLWRTVFGESE